MLVKVAPSKDIEKINAILNHPEVRPWVADMAEGYIDATDKVNNPNVTFVMGEFGGVMMVKVMAGVWECHTFCLPEGRGAWALGLVMAVQHWAFTTTDCYEILTRIPETHRAARGLALQAGMSKEFTITDGVRINDESLSVDVYKVTIQKWSMKAPELLGAGLDFHSWLNTEAAKAGITGAHKPDDEHNRIVGATLEMVKGGQPVKGVLLYNRWAWIARHATVALSSVSPTVLDMDIGQIRVAGDGGLELIPGAGSRCGKSAA